MRKLISTPTNLGITLVEAKEFLRVEHDIEDALITSIIKSSTLKAQNILGTQLTEATYEEVQSTFTQRIALLAPTQSITSITYYDESNTLQTIADTNYRLQSFGLNCYVVFEDSFDIPTVAARDDAITITFICGYLEIPPDIQMYIRIQASTSYEFREQFNSDYRQISEINPKYINQFLAPYRSYK